jgi:hypothetical protein
MNNKDIKLSWTDLKALKISKNLPLQYALNEQNVYAIYLVDNSFIVYCLIQTSTPRNSDQVDFEDNYKSAANVLILDPNVKANGSSIPNYSNLIGGKSTDGNILPIAVDTTGKILTSSLSLPTTNSKFTFGTVTTAAINIQVPVEKTTYTEQATNGQRSFASSNPGDAAAGTGARTILLTYYDQTCAGPFTETITMNGTSRVNTVATNICFIESIKVLTVGSNGSNLGTITMFTQPTSGGTTIGTVAVGDNQTFWAHHYVAAGTTCYIFGFSVNNASTAVGNGAVFVLKADDPTVSGSVSNQISDYHRLYGQSSTSTRTYLSPIQVPGPAFIRAYVSPESNTSMVQRASFDYIDN